MLSLRKLRRPGLEPVDLDLEDGVCATLEGPSGAGKSLLLRAIADLDPTEGEAWLDSVSRASIPAPQWRRQVAYLPAVPGWWRQLAREHFTDWSAAQGLLERLGLDPALGERPVRLLSTGERLRLAFARLLITEPRVLLLDEPTGPLDSDGAAAVETLLRERLTAGAAILMVTHDAAQAVRLAGQRYKMADGRLSLAG
jgi:phosphate-transporting ATPase|nr:ABC transporter ATP-binding protein [Desulfuromonadales bacterium]